MIGRHPSELTPSTEFGQLENRSRLQILLHLLLLAVCGGLLVGLVEGVGLLTFQKINWERWGKMIHVSQEIIWLSVLVDVILFSLIALLLTFLARFTTWKNTVRLAVFAYVGFAVYDFLQVTSRIHTPASVLLAAGMAVVVSRFGAAHVELLFRILKRIAVPLVLASFFALVILAGDKWFEERRALAILPPPAPGAPNVVMIV